MTREEIEKKAEEYGSQEVWQDQASFEDGAKWANAEWKEKTRWISVDEEKPKSQKIVCIKVMDRHGKEHTSLAQYVPPKTVLASDFMLEDDSECEEYDEVIDDYYVIEGWWEYQYEAETHWYIRDKVTHYREIIE